MRYQRWPGPCQRTSCAWRGGKPGEDGSGEAVTGPVNGSPDEVMDLVVL